MAFLIKDDLTDHVLECFATGFVSHFEYALPPAWGHVHNYAPLTSVEVMKVLRCAMRKQVLLGKMIGGPGWTADAVRIFFDGKNFYGIPCGATVKDGDPYGRIVHDYGFYRKGY